MIARTGTMRAARSARPDWYVDSASGHDANSGRAPGAALRTIAAVVPRIGPGDIVGLARGSHWREEFVLPCPYVTVQAYGAGEMPLLDASDEIANASFAKTGGSAFTYEIAVENTYTETSGFHTSIWEDGVRLPRKPSVADVDSTPGSYFTERFDAGHVRIYLHAGDSSDPAANGKRYEYARREHGMTIGAHSVARGIWTRRNQKDTGSFVVGPFSTAIDCLATEGTSHNVSVREGATLIGVEARDAYFGGQGGCLFVYHTNVASGEDITFRNCTARLTQRWGENYIGFFGHTGSGQFGTIRYVNCLVDNVHSGWDGEAADFVLTGCSITGDCLSAVAGHGRNLTLDGLMVPDSRTFTIQSGDALHKLTIRNSDIGSSCGWGGAIVRTSFGEIEIRDTTLRSVGNGVQTAVICLASGVRLTSQHNRFVNPLGAYYDIPKPGAVLNNDFNDYGTGSRSVYLEGTTYSLSQYRTSTGQDAHSTP